VAVLNDFDLTEAERAAFVAWNPRALNQVGGFLHLLMSIPGMEGH
jgi:hypothetical protein